MAMVFLPVDRDQTFLMPLDFRALLGDDHLVWTVLAVVEQLDLGELYRRYDDHDRGGRPAYDPAMMLALLVYAYAEGVRSSRAIERACRESWPYRAITANLEPDHATIARFRVAMDGLLPRLFARVLAVCFELGLDRVGVVAVDGTKIAAAASRKANAGVARLRVLEAAAAEIVAEAAATDASDDTAAKVSPVRHAADRARRLEAIRVATAKVDADVDVAATARAARVAAEDAAATHGRRLAGPKPKPADTSRFVANTTDPDSRLMKVPGGFIQGYNAQAVVDTDQLVLAATVSADTNDSRQLEPMLAATYANLEAAGIAARPTTALADAGYWSAANANLDVGADLLIAPSKAAKLDDETTTRARQRRDTAIAQVLAGELRVPDAARRLGLTSTRIRQLVIDARYRHVKPDAPPTKAETRLAMEAKLADPNQRAIYNQRGWMVEGVFAYAKEARNCRRFLRRGLKACDAEWKLIHLAGNIRKAWRKSAALSYGNNRARAPHPRSRPNRPCRHHHRHPT